MRSLRLVILLALLVGACTTDPPSPTPTPAVPAHNATTAPMLPTDATELPDITPGTYEELLTQLRGTPVVVNVWGSWCAPCREEAPQLAEASGRYGDRIQFIGIDIMDTRTSAIGFMEESGWTYPSFFDPSPQGDVRSSMGEIGQPVTRIYDRNGTLVADWVGAMPEGFLDKHLSALAGEPSPGP